MSIIHDQLEWAECKTKVKLLYTVYHIAFPGKREGITTHQRSMLKAETISHTPTSHVQSSDLFFLVGV